MVWTDVCSGIAPVPPPPGTVGGVHECRQRACQAPVCPPGRSNKTHITAVAALVRRPFLFVGPTRDVVRACMKWAGGLKLLSASHQTGTPPPSSETSLVTHARLTFQQQLPNDEDPPLYDVWGSSYKAMDEFGIGVGLYYRQLLTFAIVRLNERSLRLAPLGACCRTSKVVAGLGCTSIIACQDLAGTNTLQEPLRPGLS